MPGVNCVDKSHDSANEPEKPKIVYKINLNRTVMTIKENEYFTAGPDNDNKNSYEYIAFIKEVNDESPLKIVSMKNIKAVKKIWKTVDLANVPKLPAVFELLETEKVTFFFELRKFKKSKFI